MKTQHAGRKTHRNTAPHVAEELLAQHIDRLLFHRGPFAVVGTGDLHRDEALDLRITGALEILRSARRNCRVHTSEDLVS